MIEHRSIVNLVSSDLAELRLTPEDRVSQNSSAVYDSSVEEIWMAFAAGATLVVVDDAAARLGPDLVPWLRHERITAFSPTPTLLRSTGCQRPDVELPEMALIYTGGEAIPQDLADRWSKGRRMVNGYGPTECSVVATRAEIRAGEPVAIGRPVEGLEAWVLDDALEEVAGGEWGELCVSGAGLARGYLHRPAGDGREVRDASAIRQDLSDRRPGTPRARRQSLLSRADRHAGENPRVPHRVGRDRNAAGGGEGRAVGGMRRAGGRAGGFRGAENGWRAERRSTNWKQACGRRCRIIWCPAGSRRCGNCR